MTAEVGVLVVDDQPVFRRVMAALVRSVAGFTVLGEASSGEEAVELAAGIRPGLVLMDVRLPGIDGIEATRQILSTAPATRILLVSTYDARDLPGVLLCGATGFVRKQDLDRSALVDAVQA
jgi:two-component system, NarL family, invasion response regulator UvrY